MARATRGRCLGFTLVELLVVIAIIGTLMGLLLPAVQNARESARSNSCRANLTQIQLAMTNYEVTNKEYPGYVNNVGALTAGTKAGWAVMLLPYLEQQQLWEEYTKGKAVGAALDFFVCPSNTPETDGAPAMSYLANAGYIGEERINEQDDCGPTENIANGVFVDRTRDTSMSTADIRDLVPKCNDFAHDAVLRVTLATVQAQGDGSTHTLMFAEGLNALYWNHVGGLPPDKKWHFGFCWEQPEAILYGEANPTDPIDYDRDPQFRAINRLREVRGYGSMREKAENSAFPSSNHPVHVNVAFVGGNVRSLSDRISPVVYAQLMTSIAKRSDLSVRVNGKTMSDRDLPKPDADAY
jgi:prepilin-type N-terminal cleavage/methylation domain-containing protein